ncbi:MAG TPA: hypothetical protein VJ895_01470 [Candidatus Nanoarchaeia archaeon]|nr:hypothetical protein [Candidatus Nanoarchaeia archaeon]
MENNRNTKKEESSKKNWKLGGLPKFLGGAIIASYLLIGSLGEWKPWNYGKFFEGHKKIRTNYEALYGDCKTKDDSIDKYQKFGLQKYIKLKNPAIHEKTRVLSENKLEKEVVDSLN